LEDFSSKEEKFEQWRYKMMGGISEWKIIILWRYTARAVVHRPIMTLSDSNICASIVVG
jgi:hypothetical protein